MNTKTLFLDVLCVAVALAPLSARAVGDTGIALSKDILGNNKGSEYISGDYSGAVMMKINLWGPVQKPGIHYVPAKTDLVTLLSYAGGPQDKAELDDAIIKRTIGGKETIIDVDIEELLESPKSSSPMLEANDIIVIPSRKSLFSDNTVQALTVVGSIISIALGTIILRKSDWK